MAIRVILADDHSVVREGLRLFLERDSEFEVVAEAIDGTQAVSLTEQLQPDVVLMDILMPTMDGITATTIIRRDYPSTEVIALTSVLEQDTVVRMVKAGAIGYLLKDTLAPDLCKAVKSAATGQVQLSPQISAYLMREVQVPQYPKGLTEREADVLRLLAQGYSNKDIARLLHIVEDTVKSHVRHILSKLGMQSRTQAALYALRLGWVSLDQEKQPL